MNTITRNLNPEEGAAILSHGGIIAVPTETVYGLAGNALSEKAVRKIFQLKGRPPSNPLICHFASVEDVFRYGEWSSAAEKLSRFWPGPLTILLPHKGRIPGTVTAGSDLAGFRIPDHPLTLDLLGFCDFPVAAPSANRSNQRSPTDIQMVLDHFDGQIDGYLDGGPCRIGLESTVVKITDDGSLQILRPGGITEEMLARNGFEIVLPEDPNSGPLHSPGRLKKHYSPAVPLAVFTDSPPDRKPDFFIPLQESDSLVYLYSHDLDPLNSVFRVRAMLSASGSAAEAAENLFRIFDHASASGNVTFLLIRKFPDSGIGKALNDRISRAADFTFSVSGSGIQIFRNFF